jgi:hypothetical protein
VRNDWRRDCRGPHVEEITRVCGSLGPGGGGTVCVGGGMGMGMVW